MAISTSTYAAASAAAQAVMARAGAPLLVDGKWGRYTQSAYDKSPVDVRAQVDLVVRQLTGGPVAGLAAYRGAEKATARAMTTSARAGDMIALLTRVAMEEGVPVDTVLRIAWLESRFNPNAVSPTGATGLLQLTGVAVRDVSQRAGYTVIDRKNPEQNARGGVKYMKLVARDLGVPLSDAAAVYMGFNIGPTGARLVLSGQPERAAKQINQQAYGPPSVYASNLRAAVAGAKTA